MCSVKHHHSELTCLLLMHLGSPALRFPFSSPGSSRNPLVLCGSPYVEFSLLGSHCSFCNLPKGKGLAPTSVCGDSLNKHLLSIRYVPNIALRIEWTKQRLIHMELREEGNGLSEEVTFQLRSSVYLLGLDNKYLLS